MRKRKYTPLPPGPSTADADDAPEPVIHNIVSTAMIQSTKMPLDLSSISEMLPGSSYDRRKFAAMTICMSNPCCTLLLFSSGKLVVTGGRSWYEGVLSCLCATRMLQEAIVGTDFWLKSCEVQNIVAHVEVPVGQGCLDLDSMYSRLNLHCMYHKEQFPGLVYRPEASPVVLLCFYSGKIVIAGGRNTRDVEEGWKLLWPTIKVFVKTEGKPVSAQQGTGRHSSLHIPGVPKRASASSKGSAKSEKPAPLLDCESSKEDDLAESCVPPSEADPPKHSYEPGSMFCV